MNLIEIDKKITVVINSLRAEWADDFFYYVSQTWFWLPAATVLLLLGWRAWGWKRLLCVVASVAVCLLISDQLCNIIKHSVCRLRPSHEPTLEGMIMTVRGYTGGQYGFCSAHACNTSVVAVFTSLVAKRRWFAWVMVVWVLLNCWSRIYLGVHYLGDIMGGMMLGIVIAFVIHFLYKMLTDRYEEVLEK